VRTFLMRGHPAEMRAKLIQVSIYAASLQGEPSGFGNESQVLIRS
jgi:hypothetical protein